MGNPLMWLWNGSVPLFTAFGIHVRAHASLVLLIVLVLLFGLGEGTTVEARVQSMAILFVIILLHEYGHCFGARATGGSAENIMMTPLGGLAMAMARRTPWSQFVTIAAGPAVNVLICLICGFGLFMTIGVWPLGPFSFGHAFANATHAGWFQLSPYLFWFYSVSYFLLLFNILPVFPLDGGQLLQAILWKPMGYYKSMLLTVRIGLVGSVLMGMVALATFGTMMGGILLLCIAVMCFVNCMNMRRILLTEGPWAFSDEDESIYAAAYQPVQTKVKKPSKWAMRRAAKAVEAERVEQQKIDAILAKVSAHGMNSLSWLEKRTLRQATEHQRARDASHRR